VPETHRPASGHLLRYCARPPFALERLSVIRGPDGRVAKVRYVLPRHRAASWVGPGRSRKSSIGFCLASPVAVPEPSTCAMALTGLACGGYSLFRRRRAR
jgi:hypothetical protein